MDIITPLGLGLVAEDKPMELSWNMDVGYHMSDATDLIHCTDLTHCNCHDHAALSLAIVSLVFLLYQA